MQSIAPFLLLIYQKRLPCFVAPERVDMRNLPVMAVSSITAMELEDPFDLKIIIPNVVQSVSSKTALILRKWYNFATHLSCHYLLKIWVRISPFDL